MSGFRGCADRPAAPQETISARIMLNKACEAATAFRQIVHNRPGKGNTTDAEQDLLRAMLVFACAGLDAMVKELVRQALPRLLAGDVGMVSLESFVKRRTEGPGTVDHKFLASVLTSAQPRDFLIGAWVRDLTENSLQSVDALLRVTSAFEIKSSQVAEREELDELKRAFTARNQIVHEMDLNFSANRARRQRRIQDMIDLTQQVFTTANRVLLAVEGKIDHLS